MNDDILIQIQAGETSSIQFKERIINRYDIGCELVAFSNAHGGRLVIGVKDKMGEINALSYSEVQETTNLLSDIASENVVPSILIQIETVQVEHGCLVIANVKEGINKPYHDNKGVVWVKNGADKRKVFDNAELAEMMADCGSYSPDEAVVKDAKVNDLDNDSLKTFLGNRFAKVLEMRGLVGDAFDSASVDDVCSAIAKGHDCEKVLRNLRFIRPDGKMTIAAMMLFGKHTQRWLPMVTAKCICFVGNSIGGKEYRDKVNDADMEGNLLHQFNVIMDFFSRNLRNVQASDEFNSIGKQEIPYVCLVEFVVNALVHRSLNIKAPVRIFIFDNRVEIHNPGALPNGLTVDDVKSGTSLPRNMFLFNNAVYLLPYTGVGSGIARALGENVKVTFSNDVSLQQFTVTIWRNNDIRDVDLDTKRGDLDTSFGRSDVDLDTKHGDLDTSLGRSDVDLDTKRGDLDTLSKHITCPKSCLTNKQRDIVNFCSVPRTAKEILERVGVSYHSKNREHYINSLVAMGYLKMTNPNNPKASNQKYKRTDR